MPQEPLSPLDLKNAKHIVGEYEKQREVLVKFKDKGLLTVEEALSWVDAQIKTLEKELPQTDD